MENLKAFIVGSFGAGAIEVLKEMPGAAAPWVQLLIGVLTVATLIYNLIKRRTK